MSDLGKLLNEKREESGKSISEVSKATRISKQAIEHIENGKFENLPSYVHCFGFVKKYAEYLGINFDDIRSIFEAECKKDFFDEGAEGTNFIIDYNAGEKSKKTPIVTSIIVIILFLGAVLIYVFGFSGLQDKLFPGNEIKIGDNESTEEVTDNNSPLKADNITPGNTDPKNMIKDNLSDNKSEVNKILSDNSTDNTKAVDNKTVNGNNSDEITPYEITRELNKEKKPDNKTFEVQLKFSDICWVHIDLDGSKQMDFIAKKGSAKNIEFSDYFLIDIGNAAAISISYKEDTYNNLGGYREPVKNLKFVVDNGTLSYSKINN